MFDYGEEWIVIVRSSDDDTTTNITRVYGTQEEIKVHINELVKSELMELNDCYDYANKAEYDNFYHRIEAEIICNDFHISFFAIPFYDIQVESLRKKTTSIKYYFLEDEGVSL